jgi:hypothetical protein
LGKPLGALGRPSSSAAQAIVCHALCCVVAQRAHGYGQPERCLVLMRAD